MGRSVTLTYIGDGERGLDIVRALDRRLNKPVHVLTTTADTLPDVLGDDRVDGVVCGPAVGGADLQTAVFDVADHTDGVPVFNLTSEPVAVPHRVPVHHLERDQPLQAVVDRMTAAIRETADAGAEEEEKEAERTLGQHFIVDSQWTVIDWDPRLESWTDITPAAAIGKQLWNVIPAWEESELAAVIQQTAQSREPTTAEVFHKPSDRWFDVRVVPVETGGLEVFLHDVTEYRAYLFEGTDERFERMLDRITDAFFVLDNEERFVLLNSQAEFVLDVESEDVTGVRFWDVFPAAVSTAFYQEFNEAMKTQEPTSFETHYQPLDSWFEVNAYPSEDGLSVFLRDITGQRRLQDKLEHLHGMTQELIIAEDDETIATAAVDAAEDVLGFPLVTVWRYNGRTEHLDPIAYSEAIAERDVEMEPLDPNSEFLWTVYETGEERELGFVPATTATSHHPGAVNSELLVPLGEYGVISAYSDERDAFDETDIKLFRILASTIESAFARARRERQLAHRNERLDDFASIVSHDLRNPLSVAAAHAELARDADDPEESLDKIDDSLQRMEALIDDLLARARGDQELDREQLLLADIAWDAWAGVETANATLEVTADATMNADIDRVRQLFENLFRNAVEHGGEDVSVTVGPTGDGNGFYVADDGPGIPEDEREEVFEEGVTFSDDGTGYGLSIVSDIVEGHGWTVAATESQDGGARFVVFGVQSLSPEPEQEV